MELSISFFLVVREDLSYGNEHLISSQVECVAVCHRDDSRKYLFLCIWIRLAGEFNEFFAMR